MTPIERVTRLNCLEMNKLRMSKFIISDARLLSNANCFPQSMKLTNAQLLTHLQSMGRFEKPLKPTKGISIFDSHSVPVEMYSLLKDLYHGKINEYLQEILSNAEIELQMKSQDPKDANSKQDLEIKIKLAATVIDKYSGLLKMIIGSKKSLKKANQEIVNNAYEIIDSSSQKLMRINLIYCVSNLENLIHQYLEEQQQSGCFRCLFVSQSKTGLALIELLSDLRTQAFSERELIGALLSLKSQLFIIPEKREQQLVYNTLETLLTEHVHVAPSHYQQYIEEFTARTGVLKLQWPKPFVVISHMAEKAPEMHLR